MREGDLLQIPFIGAYVLYDSAASAPAGVPDGGTRQHHDGVLYEVNAVSMDAAFADDTDPTAKENLEENLGRFCPIITPPAFPIGTIDESGATTANLRYGWATRLFDCLTVRSNRHLPDVDPKTYLTNAGTVGVNDPQAVPHSPLLKNIPVIQGEEPPTTDGLINVNTAPLNVLAAAALG